MQFDADDLIRLIEQGSNVAVLLILLGPQQLEGDIAQVLRGPIQLTAHELGGIQKTLEMV